MRTKLYSVYVQKNVPNLLESAVFVKQGFNFWAFLFTIFWALYNKLWILAAVLLLVTGLFAIDKSDAFTVISLIFSIWFGFEANNFKAASLEKKRGYILFDVVGAFDRFSAEQRFYDKYQMYKSTPKQNTFSSPFKPAV